MVMVPRKQAKTMRVTAGMFMEKSMPVPERVPPRLLFPPATSVRGIEQSLF